MTQTEIDQIDALKEVVDDLDQDGFEATFIRSMAARSNSYSLSDKQADTLEQIYRRHCEDND